MTIAHAEELKSELTDKYVLVEAGVPELRRFDGLTGTVKTVNMNGRALVQFDSPEDISWYDIDPAYLTVVDEPLPKQKAEAPAAKEQAKPATAKSTGANKPAGGGSPLDAIRSQGAAKAVAAKAGDAAPAKKASPLDAIRQQGAAGGESSAPVEEPEPAPVEAETPAAEPEPTTTSDGPTPVDKSGMSTAEIIALIREQGPFKG